ncbi:nephrocystin-3 protein [Ceratobasidium sp. AG-Ba]|nr:nephrocystin-3 protein [Ceratobasidium sp. AG-Ba]
MANKRAHSRLASPAQLYGEPNNQPPPTTASAKTNPPSSIPTGRAEEIQQVSSYFLDGPSERRMFVLHGAEGSGKTWIARRFIDLMHDKFTDVVYIDASSIEKIAYSLRSCATTQRLDQRDKNIIEYLEGSQQPWLLVFDNVDDPNISLSDYIPTTSNGKILIITCDRDLSFLAWDELPSCHISRLPRKDALKLLSNTSQQLGTCVIDEEEGASKLVKELDCFALAVVQAGAYMRQRACNATYYHQIYREKRQELELSNTIQAVMNDHHKAAYTTWRINFEHLSPHATQLLHLITFIDYDRISQDIFRRARENLTECTPVIQFNEQDIDTENWVKGFLDSFCDKEGNWDSQKFLLLMEEISAYSLVEYNKASQTYSQHRLTHAWARTIIPDPSLARARIARILALSVGLDKTTEGITFRQNLVTHIDEIIRQVQEVDVNNAARYAIAYQEGDRPELTLQLHDKMLEKVRQQLGEEHTSTLGIQANVASTYGKLGRWAEAEALLEKTLDSVKRTLAKDDPAVLAIMSHLASMRLVRGQLDEAWALEMEVFEISQRNMTPEMASAVGLGNLKNLSSICLVRGQWQEAEALQLRLLEICRDALGEDHLDTISCMESLAETYAQQHQFDKAETLQRKVLEARMAILGDKNQKTMNAMHSLAQTLSGLNQAEQAEEMQTRLLALSQETLGLTHPDTLSNLDALASTYGEQERWDEAEPLYALALAGRRQHFGDEHPHTLSSMNNLAIAYIHLGRLEEAKELQEHLILHRTRIYGEGHPDVLTGINGLAMTHLQLGELDKAEELQLKAVEGRKEALGPDHPRTLTSMRNLAHIYMKQSRVSEAEELELELLNTSKRIYGRYHGKTLDSMAALSGIYQRQGKLKEAEMMQLELVDALREAAGEAHPATLASMSRLAQIYERQNRWSEAEALTKKIDEHVEAIMAEPEVVEAEHDEYKG